ncbi:lymphocyte antigen 6 complex, locus D (predicted) [Rattus norvegicus]|uniref:Lymphocyte antigen 6 family member D n=2 Tax=Rattus norvegicus TaxID=10116 RepID=D3ZF96_RAT|nr:lymphocyte antigen 6D precursor [Rattus norvegicus]EDM16088.1 lymphocyte antigen 6 complex, locus D (predicted) [Rattus norvegicus]|eukprot:NP_001124024.1 lymphocyte antigen 6D precursor [Rattus norvegicus]
MKTALLLLLALAVATSPAQAFRCHVCISSDNCRNIQTCPPDFFYCRTITKVEPLKGNLVKKECAETCTISHSQQGHVSSGAEVTLCCDSDLCNDSLHNIAPARALLSSVTLGLSTSLGLLSVVAFCL